MATTVVPFPLDTEAEKIYRDSRPEDQQKIIQGVSGAIISFSFIGSDSTSNSALYERDFFEWTQTTAALLRAGKRDEIDWHTLAEEIASLGISQKHALESHLKNLVMHLLKWYYQPSGRQHGHSWQSSIINARDEIAMILRDSPSLRREVPELLTHRYRTARKLAQSETKLPLETFPETCPWTPEQVMDEDFLPEPPEAEKLPTRRIEL